MNIGGAWIKKDKNNNNYLSCSVSIPFVGSINFVMFKNENKEKENHPDYRIVWNEKDEKKNNDEAPF